ncbi:homogentisate 1,2-dioxygenase, partial [Trichoderma arundinaceum]
MPVTEFATKELYKYQNGFNNHLESEAVEGVLPIGQNSPQKPPYGLYAEKLSGTAFTAPRTENKQTWLYRILPSCAHPPYQQAPESRASQEGADTSKLRFIPNQLRWDPFDHNEAKDLDFVTGLILDAARDDADLHWPDEQPAELSPDVEVALLGDDEEVAVCGVIRRVLVHTLAGGVDQHADALLLSDITGTGDKSQSG